jgi:hypothetical protein
MNRINQTEPATFSILSCWAFFRDSVSLYFMQIFQLHKNTIESFTSAAAIIGVFLVFEVFEFELMGS